VKQGEVGTVEAIKSRRRRWDSRPSPLACDHFRCGGSRRYERGCCGCRVETGGPETWTGDDHFEVEWPSPPGKWKTSVRKLAEYSARCQPDYAGPGAIQNVMGRLVRM